MRVAIPRFGSRVAPRGQLAREVTLAEVEGDVILSLEREPFPVRVDEDLPAVLAGLHARLLVCGGIQRELASELQEHGIGVIENVVGEVEEVLECLRHGELLPGHGFWPRAEPPESDCACPYATEGASGVLCGRPATQRRRSDPRSA